MFCQRGSRVNINSKILRGLQDETQRTLPITEHRGESDFLMLYQDFNQAEHQLINNEIWSVSTHKTRFVKNRSTNNCHKLRSMTKVAADWFFFFYKYEFNKFIFKTQFKLIFFRTLYFKSFQTLIIFTLFIVQTFNLKLFTFTLF